MTTEEEPVIKNVKVIYYSNSVGESVLARFLTGLLCLVSNILAHTQRFLNTLTRNWWTGYRGVKEILKVGFATHSYQTVITNNNTVNLSYFFVRFQTVIAFFSYKKIMKTIRVLCKLKTNSLRKYYIGYFHGGLLACNFSVCQGNFTSF